VVDMPMRAMGEITASYENGVEPSSSSVPISNAPAGVRRNRRVRYLGELPRVVSVLQSFRSLRGGPSVRRVVIAQPRTTSWASGMRMIRRSTSLSNRQVYATKETFAMPMAWICLRRSRLK
jgi:hypothetical protein